MIIRAGLMFNFYPFSGPFTKVVTVLLKITNPAWDRVCFRVCATSPKHYRVRPAYGVLESKDSRIVTSKAINQLHTIFFVCKNPSRLFYYINFISHLIQTSQLLCI